MPFSKNRKIGGRDASPEPSTSCRREKYVASSDEEDQEPPLKKGKSSSKLSKHGSNKKATCSSKQTGHGSHNKPAELFRKDLISAMKLADTEILFEEDYVVISDPWRQEWEKGVQVPVNEKEILPVVINKVETSTKTSDFKIPPRKYLHEQNDETYQSAQHELTGMQEMADVIVRYDMDDMDVKWLELVNEDRDEMALQLINEWNCERMIEELENQCYAKTLAVKKTEEGLGIEYDEDVACDVCRQLESEDTNEMVFCDGCDLCVHQACYGIQTIPEGSWLCRICALGIKPMCLLCPKRGGAMKSTRSGSKWAHVSCALWIPEVSIDDSEKMEPVTKIGNIPPSRWALVCTLCKERVGACIQCSVKTCKTAFHVTCGFAHNLDMKTVLDDSEIEEDSVHLKAYCPKHTKHRKMSDAGSPKKEEEESNEDVSEVDLTKQRMEKLRQLEEEFYEQVDLEAVSTKFYIPIEAVDVVAEYWKLKRKINGNKPLITPKTEEEDRMQKQQKDSLSARMKMFVHLRQDLERARNLCYMIAKREKTKRQFLKNREFVFRSQVRVLTDPQLNLSAREAEKVRQMHKFDSVYNTYGVSLSGKHKPPRENVFTLENLKTPKDLEEEANIKKKLPTGSWKVNKKRIKKKSGDSSASVESLSVQSAESSCSKALREHPFSDSLKLSDSTLDTSDDDFFASRKQDSTHMSRLGKEKRPHENESDNTPTFSDGQTDANPKRRKLVQGGDLRKKLTSILNSKNVSNETLKSLNETLVVDVGRSDSEIFTSDTNTDLMSPPPPRRNLFDKFSVPQESPKAESSSIPLSSGDGPVRKKKSKKRKRSKSPHKNSKHKSVTSSSEQSDVSVSSHKRKVTDSGDKTREKSGSDKSNKTDQTKGSTTSREDLTTAQKESEMSPTPKRTGSHKRSSSKHKSSSSKKKKCHKRRRSSSTSRGSSHKSPHQTKLLDIYKPQPTDTDNDSTKNIESTDESLTSNVKSGDDLSKQLIQSKLKLKKQQNSPVKGGISSYEVVKEEVKVESNEEKTDVKEENIEEKNLFNRVLGKASKNQDLDKSSSESSVSSDKYLRERHKQEEIGKQVNEKPAEKDENPFKEKCKKDLFDIGSPTIKSSPRRIKRRSALRKASSVDEDYSSDENFRPNSKNSPGPRLNRPKRTIIAKTLHSDETEGDDDSDDFQSDSRVTRNSSQTIKSNVKLKQFDRPHLNELLDPSKLVVKESLRRQVTERMKPILKNKNKQKILRPNNKNQRTLDNFVTKTVKNNVFMKVYEENSEISRRYSISDQALTEVSQSESEVTSSRLENNQDILSPSRSRQRSTSVFGAHSSPTSTYRIPKKSEECTPTKLSPGTVFGDLNNKLSFTDIRQSSEVMEEVIKTPSKCDPVEMREDRLEGNGNYRSQSPSSEGSGASTRLLSVESRESTPRRMTRSRITEDSPGSHLRSKDIILKPAHFKAS